MEAQRTQKSTPAFASSLAAAALDGLFDHPAGCSDAVPDLLECCVVKVPKWFFNNLLGTMYHLGQGVPWDDVLAHMWVTLAAAHGIEVVVKWRDLFEKSMTTAQLLETQRLAREWKPKGE